MTGKKVVRVGLSVMMFVVAGGCSRSPDGAVEHGDSEKQIDILNTEDSPDPNGEPRPPVPAKVAEVPEPTELLDETIAEDRPDAIPIPEPVAPLPLPEPPPMGPSGLPAKLSPPPFLVGPDGEMRATVRMEPSLSDLGSAWKSGETGQSNFSMPLPDGRDAVVVVDQFVAVGDDGGEFIGTLEGFPGSRVSLSYRGSGEVGMIEIPSEQKRIRIFPGMNGGLVMVEEDIGDGKPGAKPGVPGPPPDFVPPVPSVPFPSPK